MPENSIPLREVKRVVNSSVKSLFQVPPHRAAPGKAFIDDGDRARSVQVIVVRRPYESRHWLRSLSYDWFAAEVTDMHQAIGFSSINVTAPFSTSMKNGISGSSESEKLRPQSMKRYCVSAVSLSMVRDRLGLWI